MTAACAMCEWGHPRIQGEHYTTRGEKIARCTAPDAERPGPAPFPFRERFEAWRLRVAEMGKLPMPRADAPVPPRPRVEVEEG